MEINQYSAYSNIVSNEKENEKDLAKLTEFLENLEKLEEKGAVLELVKEKWNIRDDIDNFSIGNNTRLSIVTGKENFVVTVENEDEVKSFCYDNSDKDNK